MSKQFKCPECGSEQYSECSLMIHGNRVRVCSGTSCFVAWPHDEDSRFLTEVPNEPPRPTEDEPKESVKEIPISYKHRVAACAMIDGNPMTLQKIACYNWETFMGFLYADGTIEADYKRVRDGQVEWATHVRVKE